MLKCCSVSMKIEEEEEKFGTVGGQKARCGVDHVFPSQKVPL